MLFNKLGLSENIVRGVQAMGYVDPTPIQLRAIPPALEGKDVIASAQTGTGKTAAFALPTLHRLHKHGAFRCLVLEPTRELAAQVETAFRDYARFSDLRVAALYGGVGYGQQKRSLQNGVDIVVATPGRLEDHMQQGTIRLETVEILILDEVDRMLDIGFMKPVKRIVSRCPKGRQTLFFSATLPAEIQELASWALSHPVKIEVSPPQSVTKTVTHALYPINESQKFNLLLALLEKIDFNSVLIFCRTKIGADRIARQLREAKHSVATLHANRSQSQRMEALAGFRSGKYELMVATDIAARGIDVAGISHVINYDVPHHPEDYVHRIGRTGRALSVGDAFTLMTPDEEKHVKAIERFIGQPIERTKLESFTYFPIALSNKTSDKRSFHMTPAKSRFGKFRFRGARFS